MAMKDRTEQVLRAFGADALKRVTKAAIVLSRYAREKSFEKLNRDGSTPSKPGEYPAQVTGNFARSIGWETGEDKDGHFSRWGIPEFLLQGGKNYGRDLQVFKNRPWMSRANAEKSTEVKDILGEKL